MLITRSILNQQDEEEFRPGIMVSDRTTAVECPVQDPLTWNQGVKKCFSHVTYSNDNEARNNPLSNNNIIPKLHSRNYR